MLRTRILLCSVSPIFLLQSCISSSLTGVIRSDSSRLEMYTSELGYPTHWQQTWKDRTCIVPKKACAGSSRQWLTQTHEMGSDESSLILSCLWPQSHGRRAACSLLLWGVLCALPATPGMHKYVSWTHSPGKTMEIIQPMCKKGFAEACNRLSHE